VIYLLYMRKIGILLILAILFGFSIPVKGATVEELQSKINQNSSTIQQLQEEIKQLSTQLGATAAQRKTLQNTINQLELNSKKLQNEISLTESKIGKTDLQIQELAVGINEKITTIERNKIALAESIRNLQQNDSQSPMEQMLSYPDISTFSTIIEAQGKYQNAVREKLNELETLKHNLESDKDQTEQKKDELVTLKSQLADQNKVIEVNKSEQTKVLVQTKSKEALYQQMIAEKKAKEKAFEDELNAYQAQLKIILDPSKIPTAKTGVLSWPFSPHIVTQYFGNTEFAQSGAYNGQGHNGIDIGTPIGTAVGAAGDGVVKGTGDTDSACPGASFGKWVLIQHNNGLSSLYGHLSVIKVSAGQEVKTGDLIAYSGNTGYSTGPHLHFTVYATQGVQIVSRPSAACNGRVYTLPVADLKAYLNPMSYL
jgi:murein DD-endopeptidase MepM/ murein hydrolase activator NlpD